jgi:hypothetical protein
VPSGAAYLGHRPDNRKAPRRLRADTARNLSSNALNTFAAPRAD